MGELCVLPEDLPRYVKDGHSLVTPAMTAKLDALVKEIESQNVTFKGWATPGATVHSAALDVARTSLPPRGAPRVRVEGVRRAGERRDHHLSQSLERSTVAVRALGGDQTPFSRIGSVCAGQPCDKPVTIDKSAL